MEINKEKEQKALTGFILSIISICLWLVILIIWLYTNVFQFVDHKILNLFMSILWSLGCATGIVFGIIVLAKLKYSDGITKNPYKTFRIISKILSIVSIVINSILMLVSFIVITGTINTIYNV